jgi:hypothetical protein
MRIHDLYLTQKLHHCEYLPYLTLPHQQLKMTLSHLRILNVNISLRWKSCTLKNCKHFGSSVYLKLPVDGKEKKLHIWNCKNRINHHIGAALGLLDTIAVS